LIRALAFMVALSSWPAWAAPPPIGVRFTARVTPVGGADPASSGGVRSWPAVAGTEVHVLGDGVLFSTDLASGATRTRPAPGWQIVVAADGRLVALGAAALFGVDPATLAPTWSAPSHARVAFAFGPLVADDPGPDHRLVARRAADGQVAWEAVLDGTVAQIRADGPFVYVRTVGVVALDAATGRRLWSAPGSEIFSAADGQVAIWNGAAGTEIHAGADGHVLAAHPGQRVWLGPGYEVAAGPAGLAARARGAATPRWQRAGTEFVAGLDDVWVYAVATEPRTLDVLDAATGAVALSFPVEAMDHETVTPVGAGRRPGDPRAVVVVAKRWLVAIGDRPAPAEPHAQRITGRLLRPHCTHGEVDAKPPVPLSGTRLDIGGVAAATDAAGRFQLTVPNASGAPLAASYRVNPALAFPAVIVPDGQPLELIAFIEYGCPR
jgi:outer membrane protein assembly factor BamB